MTLTVHQTSTPSVIRVDISGQPSLASSLKVIDDLHRSRTTWRNKYLLLDLRQLTQVPDVSVQAIMGEHIATQLWGVKKIACVAAACAKAKNTQAVGRRYGANITFFTDEDDAFSWLQEE